MKRTLVSLSLSALILSLVATLLPGRSQAQTVQGDIYRGQGRFLAGAGWYNLNTAAGADRINVETWKSHNREVQRLYRDFMIDRYRRTQYKKGLTGKVQQDFERKYAEAEQRWRTNPTPEDIGSGDALNALAGDLADPSVAPSSWRSARVELPPDMALTALAFKVADPKSGKLLQSTVAVDRMLIKDRWPLAFRRPEIEPECASYQNAIAMVVDKCRKGTQLQAADYDTMRNSVSALQKKLETAIPASDDQRRKAREYVKGLDDATKVFAEEAYGEQLVRDVSEHSATTIAELLGFMRQYRLLFSDPGSSPEVAALYERLYGLLRQQKDSLHISMPTFTAPAPRPSDIFQVGTIWDNGNRQNPFRVKVDVRDEHEFKGTWIGKDSVREIRGKVTDNAFSFALRDVHVLKGGPVVAKNMNRVMNGTFQGDEIHISSTGGAGPKVNHVLRKVR